jgi:hypothetical protein
VTEQASTEWRTDLTVEEYAEKLQQAKAEADHRFALYENHENEDGSTGRPERQFEECWKPDEPPIPNGLKDVYKTYDHKMQLINEKMAYINGILYKKDDFKQLRKNINKWIIDTCSPDDILGCTPPGVFELEKYLKRKAECGGVHPSTLMSERIWEFWAPQHLSLRNFLEGNFFDLDSNDRRVAFLQQLMRTGKMIIALFIALMAPEEKIHPDNKYPVQPVYTIRSSTGELTPVYDHRILIKSQIVSPVLKEFHDMFAWKSKSHNEMKTVTDADVIRKELRKSLLYDVFGHESMTVMMPEQLGGGTVISCLINMVYYFSSDTGEVKWNSVSHHCSGIRICSLQTLNNRVWRGPVIDDASESATSSRSSKKKKKKK